MAIYPSGSIISNRFEVVQGPGEKPSLAGGMGLVYLCVDHAEKGKPVALKTFRPDLLSDRAARDRFLREGTTWVELGKHPHIVRCYEVFKAVIGFEVFFSLELVAAAEGKRDSSLRSWLIPGKPLPLELALLFALHICRGMMHATHKIPGMVHRDLKPENILIGRDGRSRVTDFGLASAAQNLDIDRQMENDKSSSPIRTQLKHGIAGTPLYMAPEQWKGELLDERADIYAFGCILYEMICGSYAVTGKSIKELERAHCQGQLNTIPSSVPSVINGLLHRCLFMDAVHRYSDWTELGTDLANVYAKITDEPVPVILTQEQDTLAERVAVGWSYNAIGISYADIGKFKVAKQYFERVLKIAHEENVPKMEATSLGNIGNIHNHFGEHQEALKYHEKHLNVIRKLRDRHDEGAALGNIGNSYRMMGNLVKAIEYYEQNLAITREIADLEGEGMALASLAIVYSIFKDEARAIQYCEQHLNIARSLNDIRGEMQALSNLGNIQKQFNKPAQAIALHEQSLQIAQEIGDREGEGLAISNIGNVYVEMGQFDKASDKLNDYLEIMIETGNRKGEANALHCIGNVSLRRGNALEAIDFFERSIEIMRKLEDNLGEGQVLLSLGNAFQSIGRLDKAKLYYEQRLNLAHTMDDLTGEAAALGNLGVIFYNLGEFRQAIHYHEQHLKLARNLQDRRGEGIALCNLGNVYNELKDANRAIACFKQDLEIARDLNDRFGEGQTLGNMANSYQILGDFQKAIQLCEQAMMIMKEVGSLVNFALFSRNLAILFYDLQQDKKALQHAITAAQAYQQVGQFAEAHETQQIIKEIEQQLLNLGQQPKTQPHKRWSDPLHFSAFAPPIVKPQSRFLLYIWAFMKKQREEMLVLASQNDMLKQTGTKGPIRILRGTEITVCVDLPDFEVYETIDKIIWEGEISSTSFAVSVPKDIDFGKHLCKAKIISGGIQLSRLYFEIEVGQEQEDSKTLKTEEQIIRSVFASYASEDRLEALRWARGAQAVGVDVFLDVLSLREGQYWEEELWKHVPAKDLFCLFWSEPASKSSWVEKEWKCALATRGLDYIHPVLLVDPRKVPPPKELSAKHFNDLTRIVIQYEEMSQNK